MTERRRRSRIAYVEDIDNAVALVQHVGSSVAHNDGARIILASRWAKKLRALSHKQGIQWVGDVVYLEERSRFVVRLGARIEIIPRHSKGIYIALLDGKSSNLSGVIGAGEVQGHKLCMARPSPCGAIIADKI